MQILKKLRAAFLLPSLAAGLAACENVIEVPIPEHAPKLAVRCVISTEKMDTTYFKLYPENQPYVSQSRSILSSEFPPAVANATMVITDASGNVVETFQPGLRNQPGSESSGFYAPVTEFKPEAGKYYKLTVSAPGFETVTGELALPEIPQGVSATFIKKASDPYQVNGRLSITIPDNAAQENYYFVQVTGLDSLHRPIPYFPVQEEKDEDGFDTSINNVQLSYSYQIFPFDDKTFNGRSFTTAHDVYYYVFTGGPNMPRVKYLRAIVGSLTKDTFLFHKSVEMFQDTDGNPFSEPTRIQGNIKNGYGFFGGHSNAYVDIPLN